MKSMLRILPPVLLLVPFLVPKQAIAQIPVTDAANLANNTLQHAENIAKWVDSIAKLKTQIDQLNQQIAIADDIRKWSGNPVEAATKVVLEGLGAEDLVKTYGQTKSAIIGLTHSLGSLGHTANGSYRAITSVDLDGNELARDPLLFRRYSLLDSQQANADTVRDDTASRESALQEEIALTLADLKTATTEAEVQKLTAKLTVLNGQLAQVEAQRRRAVDEVALQKTANDARLEQERIAAAELAAKDDHLANQRVSAYLKTVKFRVAKP